jgi:hypothetical protein
VRKIKHNFRRILKIIAKKQLLTSSYLSTYPYEIERIPLEILSRNFIVCNFTKICRRIPTLVNIGQKQETLNPLAPEFFLNFSTPCISNVNITGTKKR